MTRQQKIDYAVETARQAQIRDDVCSRSVLVGLKTILSIPEEMIAASFNLCGGTGSASGSCGAYCSGLLAVGLKYNAPLEEELENPELQGKAAAGFIEYRDRFMKEMGTILCPEIHKKLFGRSYILTDPIQQQEFLALEGHHIKCAEAVAVAARIAAEMILTDENE